MSPLFTDFMENSSLAFARHLIARYVLICMLYVVGYKHSGYSKIHQYSFKAALPFFLSWLYIIFAAWLTRQIQKSF